MLKNYIEKHLKDRGIDLKDKSKYPVFIDKENNIATFPLYNLMGRLVGYQQYNPKGNKALNAHRNDPKEDMKYYSYFGTENDDFKKIKKIGLYGLHTLNNIPIIILVEGIFDAISLIKLGYPAIATMTNDPKPLKNFFFILQKKVIAIMDNDPDTKSGDKLKRIAHKAYKIPDPYKDANEMPQNELKKFMKEVVKL